MERLEHAVVRHGATLLEALSLWQGAPARAALCTDESPPLFDMGARDGSDENGLDPSHSSSVLRLQPGSSGARLLDFLRLMA